MTFTEYFREISAEVEFLEELIPGLLEYYRDPTMSHARALLETVGVPIPYEELRLFNESGVKGTNVSECSFTNATLRQRRSDRRAGRRHRKWKRPVADADFFAAYRYIDMLRDLVHPGTMAYIPCHLLNEVTGASIPLEVSKQLWRILCIDEQSAIGEALVALAERVGAQVPGSAPVQIDLHPAKRATSLHADIHFAYQVGEWFKRPTLEIVLDDVFTEPLSLPDDLVGDARTLCALNGSEPLRSLTLCAFLQLAIGTWDASLILAGSDPSAATAVRDVRFFIETFQTLEVGGYEEFLKSWVHYLRTESPHLRALSAANVTYGSVSVADAVAATATVAAAAIDPGSIESDGIRSHDMFVPYRLPERLRDSVPSRCLNTRTAAQFLSKYRDYFYTSYSKQWLRKVYSEYRSLSKHHRNFKDVRQFMAALFDINALRNSLRADFALSRDAVFITGDHLALVYYAKRAEQLGKKRTGLAIDINGGCDMTARIYPDPAAAPQLALLSKAPVAPDPPAT